MSEPRPASPVERARPQRGPATADPARAERQRRSSRLAWMLAGMMMVTVVVLELPNEVIAWKFAAALEARESGDKERADRLLAEVLERQPDERYEDCRYFWNKEDGKYEAALEILQKRFAAKPGKTEDVVRLLNERITIYQHLRRHEEAVADAEEMLRLSQTTGWPSREDGLNALAYARAVAGVELEAALADANSAIVIYRAELQEAEQKLQQKKGDIAFVDFARKRLAGCLDTRGFVLTKLGKYEAAQADLDEAISYINARRKYYQANRKEISSQSRLFSHYVAKQKERNQHDAVFFYHRSLNLEKLGRTAEADRDFNTARLFAGRQPDETLF